MCRGEAKNKAGGSDEMKSLNEIGRELDVAAYVVDPVVVDEMKPIARITGLPEEFFLIIISLG